MKTVFKLIALLMLNIYFANGQSFELIVEPQNQSILAGQTAEFRVTILPQDGFNGTVLLSADFPASFSKNYVNPPYDNVVVTITPSILDTGQKKINIKGESGKIQSTVLCMINIAKNTVFGKVDYPVNSSILYSPYCLLKDVENNLCVIGHNGGKNIELCKYSEQNWETKSILTNIPWQSQENYYNYEMVNDSIWIINNNNLVLIEDDNINVFNYQNSDLPNASFEGIKLDNSGNPLLYIQSKNNPSMISLVLKNASQIKDIGNELYIKEYNSIRNSMYYNQVQFDRNNNLWVVDSQNDLYRVSSNLDDINKITTIDNKIINVDYILKDKNNDIWFLSEKDKKIYFYDLNSVAEYSLPANISNIRSFVITDENNFWFATNNNIYNYSNGVYTFYSSNFLQLSNSSIQNITLDKNSNLWITLNKKSYYLVFNPNGLVGVPIITSVEEDESAYPAMIYPNPASESLYFDLGNLEVANLVIYDVLGNEVLSITDYHSKSDIDISGFVAGIYTVQSRNAGNIMSKQFVVRR